MAAEYDNLLKYLAEHHARSLASWLMGKDVGERARLIKTELSLQPIRADWIAQFDLEDEILHAEFETDPAGSDPPLPLRMLDYFVRNDMTAAAGLLAGLRFDGALIKRLFREEIMIQSSLYQSIVERSEQRGMRLGKLDLLQELLLYKFGVLPEAVKKALADLNLDSLAHLSKALLEFKSVDDLHAWLKENQQTTVSV